MPLMYFRLKDSVDSVLVADHWSQSFGFRLSASPIPSFVMTCLRSWANSLVFFPWQSISQDMAFERNKNTWWLPPISDMSDNSTRYFNKRIFADLVALNVAIFDVEIEQTIHVVKNSHSHSHSSRPQTPTAPASLRSRWAAPRPPAPAPPRAVGTARRPAAVARRPPGGGPGPGWMIQSTGTKNRRNVGCETKSTGWKMKFIHVYRLLSWKLIALRTPFCWRKIGWNTKW